MGYSINSDGLLKKALCKMSSAYFVPFTSMARLRKMESVSASEVQREHACGCIKKQNPREINHASLIESDDKELLSIYKSVMIPLMIINFL